MIVIPAIDLRSGKVVRLAQGEYDRESRYGVSAVDTARGFVDAGANLYAKTKAGRTPVDESGGEDNKTAADVRRGNDQSRELLEALMKTHPDPAKGLASTGR